MGLFNHKPARADQWTTAPAPHGALAIEISRAGAAVAAAEHDGREPSGSLAFFEHEITTVENAVRIIEEAGFAGPESLRANREFLVRLHARLGYAQAVDYLAGHPVVRRQFGGTSAG